MPARAIPLWGWRALTAAWAVVIAWLSREPFSSHHTRGRLARLWLFLTGQPADPTTLTWINLAIRKTAHLGEYSILALLLYRSMGGQERPLSDPTRALWTILLTVSYSFTDEFHQLLEPGRGPSLFDTGLDTLGAILALSWLEWRATRKLTAGPSWKE